MEGVNGFLDGLFNESAKQKEQEQKRKVFFYRLFTNAYMDNLKAVGKCKVVSVAYDKTIDCNIFICEDIRTRKRFCCNQFMVELKEVV